MSARRTSGAYARACTVAVLLALGLGSAARVGPDAAAEDDPMNAGVPAALRTVAEASGFTRTSTSAEVEALTLALCARSAHLRAFSFGRTSQDRPLTCTIVADPMPAGPEALVGDGRLVVLVLGNIHSGECAGKEALLMLLRELALEASPAWLEDIVLLVAPNYNADGNDDLGPNATQRKGQLGPEEMGTRANAQGLDLNRDFIKLASPEARALVALMTAWNPHLFIDCHTTNGSWHRYPLTYDVPHNPAAPEPVRALLRGRLIPDVTRALEAQGFASFYYGNFNRAHTQWTTYGYEGRYSTEYVGLRGRLAILSEAYSYIPYKRRILATKAFVRACVDWARAHAKAVKQATAAREAPVREVPIRATVTAFPEPVVVKGYALPAPVDGKRPDPRPHARPKPTTPADHKVEFLGRYVATTTVTRPYAYAVPASLGSVAERLRQHGIRVDRLDADVERSVEVSRITSATKSAGAFQGHHLTQVVAVRRTERRRLQQGHFIVRTDQPLGVLAVTLLEAESADGFVTWELFGEALQVDADYPVLRITAAEPLPLASDPGARPGR